MRLHRWMAALVIAPLLVAAPALGSERTPPPLQQQARAIATSVLATWTCQDQLGQERTPVARTPWTLPRSSGYRAWVLNLWKERRSRCITTLHERGRIWRRLHQGLRGTRMAGTERELEAAGRRYGVSPYFIAAIAATESSLGAAACGPGGYNAWGLANCDGRWSVPEFRSWADGYMFMARFLSERWPNAIDPWDYRGYAACSDCWGNRTAQHMGHLFGVGYYTRYPGTPPG